jgi:hypothetical protein
VETAFNNDDKQDHAVSQEGNDVETADRYGDPDVSKFQSREGSEEEIGGRGCGVIENQHGELRTHPEKNYNNDCT